MSPFYPICQAREDGSTLMSWNILKAITSHRDTSPSTRGQGGRRYATSVATSGVITCSTISAEKWAIMALSKPRFQ